MHLGDPLAFKIFFRFLDACMVKVPAIDNTSTAVLGPVGCDLDRAVDKHSSISGESVPGDGLSWAFHLIHSLPIIQVGNL